MAICLPYALSLLAQSPDAEHLQYPDVFFMLFFHRGKSSGLGVRIEVEVGRGGGGFQSDRPTEKSDNERSGLSGVQTASCAR